MKSAFKYFIALAMIMMLLMMMMMMMMFSIITIINETCFGMTVGQK